MYSHFTHRSTEYKYSVYSHFTQGSTEYTSIVCIHIPHTEGQNKQVECVFYRQEDRQPELCVYSNFTHRRTDYTSIVCIHISLGYGLTGLSCWIHRTESVNIIVCVFPFIWLVHAASCVLTGWSWFTHGRTERMSSVCIHISLTACSLGGPGSQTGQTVYIL